MKARQALERFIHRNWPPDARQKFEDAWNEADKAETLQRLDGMTKAVPVASIGKSAELSLDDVRGLVAGCFPYRQPARHATGCVCSDCRLIDRIAAALTERHAVSVR
jgi:hypothetical protein